MQQAEYAEAVESVFSVCLLVPAGTSEAAGGKFNLSLQPFQNARWLDDVAATEIVAS